MNVSSQARLSSVVCVCIPAIPAAWILVSSLHLGLVSFKLKDGSKALSISSKVQNSSRDTNWMIYNKLKPVLIRGDGDGDNDGDDGHDDDDQ